MMIDKPNTIPRKVIINLPAAITFPVSLILFLFFCETNFVIVIPSPKVANKLNNDNVVLMIVNSPNVLDVSILATKIEATNENPLTTTLP